jgi:DNA (cytosine-5)-methyltransferase 1
MRKLRLLSLCSGIGVIDYVWSFLLDQEIAGQVEIDPYCTALLAERWPDVPRRLDIKEVAADEHEARVFGDVDVVAGGIPCQPFSEAGKRRGTQDDRYLWPSAFSIVQRYKPSWVLIENVAGFVSLALDLVQTDLESADYQVQAYVLPACAVGAPHERERVFIVAHTTSSRWQECQNTERTYHQPHASGALAHTSSTGWQTTGARQQAIASFQCGKDVAYSDSNRWWQRQDQPQCQPSRESSTDISHDGTQGTLAHAHPSGLQIGNGCPGQAWAPTSVDGCLAGQSQSRMGRSFDGFADWLDRTQWPSPPGQPQKAWEPARTVTTKVPHRAVRIKALGNAIVPQQIYPFLRFIVDDERKRMEVLA